MDHKLISLSETVQIVERNPEGLSHKVVEELIDLVQDVETEQDVGTEEGPSSRAEPASWFYRMPFPGVRYYYYD